MIRNNPSIINIIDIIPKKRFYVQINQKFRDLLVSKIKKYKIKDIIPKLKTSRSTLCRILYKKNHWMNLETLFSLCRVIKISIKKLKNNIITIKTKDSFPISVLNLKINEQFARFIGHLIGDGGIHLIEKEGKYRVFYVNNEHILLNSFLDDVSEIFGDIPIYMRERKSHGDEVWLPTTVGLIVYSLLGSCKSKKTRIPNIILNSKNPVIINNFLQAIFDDEGFLYSQKNMIGISLANKGLLLDIKDILKQSGINSNPVHQRTDQPNMFYFYITDKKNLIKFSEEINFLHPMKRQKLTQLVNKYS